MSHVMFYAIVPVVAVMTAGFLAGKAGAFTAEGAKVLNKLVLDFALPAALFISIVTASREQLVQDIKLSIVSLVVIMACFMLVYYFYKYVLKQGGANAAVMALVSGSPTIGFLGFAVLEPIFNATAPGGLHSVALVVAIVGIVVNAVGIPVGLSLLNSANAETAAGRNGGIKPDPWKPVIQALCQPVAWAPVLAVILVVLGIKWPTVLDPSFNLISKANASVAVFAAGVTLSSIKLSVNWPVIWGVILKMFLMPALLLAVGLLVRMDPWSLKMMVIAGALPPAFSGIIIADEYDTYVATGTGALTISVIAFIATCPLWLWICDWAMKVF